jgi:hypothetical protein
MELAGRLTMAKRGFGIYCAGRQKTSSFKIVLAIVKHIGFLLRKSGCYFA